MIVQSLISHADAFLLTHMLTLKQKRSFLIQDVFEDRVDSLRFLIDLLTSGSRREDRK